jgi:hypothetical protein
MTVPAVRISGRMHPCEHCGRATRRQYRLLLVIWPDPWPPPLVLQNGKVARLTYWYLCLECCLHLPELRALGALAQLGEDADR